MCDSLAWAASHSKIFLFFTEGLMPGCSPAHACDIFHLYSCQDAFTFWAQSSCVTGPKWLLPAGFRPVSLIKASFE